MDTAIDSLQAFELLKESGMPEMQARACVETFQKVLGPPITAAREEIQEIQKTILNDLVKKNEVPYLKDEFQQGLATKADLLNVRNELDQKIQDVRNELTNELANVKVSLIKWFIGTALAMTSLSLAAFALMWEMFLKNAG